MTDDIVVPADVREYGARHNLEEWAASIYRAGYIDATQRHRRGRCWYWLDGDPEYCGADPGEVLDYADVLINEPVKLGVSVDAGHVWAVRLVITRDADGDPDETEVRHYPTYAQAFAAMGQGSTE